MSAIHIVGGGVAGLALAGLLPTAWRVHLLEADWDQHRAPTAFGMWPAAMHALDALGLAGAVRSRGRHLDTARIHAHTGRQLASVGRQDVWLIPQTDLIDLLRQRLPESVEVHSHRVATPDELDGDLVIGADGVHSVVRRARWIRAGAARRLGATVLRGVVDETIADDSLREFWGVGDMMGMTPQPDGGTNWFVGVPQRHFDGSADALAHVRSRLADYPELTQKVLRAADPSRTLVNDLWAARWPGRLVRGRNVLIGDAAHAMAPNLGRGACESLIDAAVLGRSLASMPIGDALRHYDRHRRLGPQIVRFASERVLGVAMADRHARARNMLISAAPVPSGRSGHDP